jgi:hypothetical protein
VAAVVRFCLQNRIRPQIGRLLQTERALGSKALCGFDEGVRTGIATLFDGSVTHSDLPVIEQLNAEILMRLLESC